MRSTYFELGDVLRIRLSDLPIAREVAQGRHVQVAYADNGTVVELVLLQARGAGLAAAARQAAVAATGCNCLDLCSDQAARRPTQMGWHPLLQ
jgi:hypothetical protein